ncbi:MAG: mechanosensitive ion channel [Candidatus Marinimicrobia bacterium]|nr:mechanosensitive ion channel [Candidatus Neomarinimicrobiota bacterium]
MDIITLIEEKIGISGNIQLKVIKSLVLLVFLFGLRFLFLKILFRQSEDVKTRYIWRKTVTYFVTILFFLLTGLVWMSGLKSLGTYLGLLSAGIAIALKEPVTNLFGWIFIVFRKPFVVGDRIEIGGIKGDIIDIGVSQIVMIEVGNWVGAEQSTGRIVHIPNNWIFAKSIANYTMGFQYIWNEISLVITFESNWQKAKKILQDILHRTTENISHTAEKEIKNASRKFMIYYKHLTPIVYTRVNDFGVVLTLRFLINPRHKRGIEQQVWEQILEEFEKHGDIDFAYPTQRFYNNLDEGKPGKNRQG